jgi:hypothetical protein
MLIWHYIWYMVWEISEHLRIQLMNQISIRVGDIPFSLKMLLTGLNVILYMCIEI